MTMPTFEGKSKKLELSEDLFKTSLHIQSAHKRRQDRLLPLSHAWSYVANIQKHHQPSPRDCGRKLDGFR